MRAVFTDICRSLEGGAMKVLLGFLQPWELKTYDFPHSTDVNLTVAFYSKKDIILLYQVVKIDIES
jgi:hypothetical protein